MRGTGTITAGAEPLYVVDGVPLERASSALETVDMNDVESIEILRMLLRQQFMAHVEQMVL